MRVYPDKHSETGYGMQWPSGQAHAITHKYIEGLLLIEEEEWPLPFAKHILKQMKEIDGGPFQREQRTSRRK